VQEAADDLLAELGVRDLWVELRRIELARRVLHRCDGRGGGATGDDEACRRRPYAVAVAHPHLRRLGQAIQ